MLTHGSLHRDIEHIVFVGDAGRTARGVARALERLGYATAEAPTVGAIGGARPPVAIVVAAQDGVDPFRGVRAVRARPGFAHALVFVATAEGFDPPIGLAIAAGADDVLAERMSVDESVDRIAGRQVRSRALQDRARFDCVTQVRGRLFVNEWLSAEVGVAVAEHGRASLATLWLSGFAASRADRGFLATEREVEDVAFALAAGLRPCDLPCRLSDDTFVVLVPGASAAVAAALLRDARARMNVKSKAVGDVVIGVAEAPDEGVTWQQLFSRGESRLRRARATVPARSRDDAAPM